MGGTCMKANIQIQSNPVIANADDIELIVKTQLKASDIKLETIDELDIYYKPYDGSIYYVATTVDGQTFKNVQPLFI